MCYRLYSARTAAALPAHQPAEIHRIGLEQVCLQVVALGDTVPLGVPLLERVPLKAPLMALPRVPLVPYGSLRVPGRTVRLRVPPTLPHWS